MKKKQAIVSEVIYLIIWIIVLCGCAWEITHDFPRNWYSGAFTVIMTLLGIVFLVGHILTLRALARGNIFLGE